MIMKKILILSLAFNIIGVGFFIGKRIYLSHQNAAHPPVNFPDDFNRQVRQLYEALPIDSGSIVFVGTSHTAMFPVNEIFRDTLIYNRGIAANRSAHLLGRIGMIAMSNPSKLYIEIGTNDLMNAVSIDSLLDNYRKIISTIYMLSHPTKIYVTSVFPIFEDDKHTNDSIRLFNQRLKAACGSDIGYINVYDHLVKNGALDSTLTVDGIHLNAEGYCRWARAISQQELIK